MWSLNERYSAVIAFAIILIYLALYALFLQPFLGDAARYFRASPGNVAVRREIRRQAVDMLDTLHKWGNYDRIIIVAHSLGTVVAYDMLRAISAGSTAAFRIPSCWNRSSLRSISTIRTTGLLAIMNEDDFRVAAREIVRKIAAQTISSIPSYQKRPAWLVTDFVTLGSPLTHARYLMCDGNTEQELNEDFERRVLQREFPVCPPAKQGDDGLLSFHNGQTDRREFQHAALFGLTRWTNLFFPMSQMFWGDASGSAQGTFGRYIETSPSPLTDDKPAFFTLLLEDYRPDGAPFCKSSPCARRSIWRTGRDEVAILARAPRPAAPAFSAVRPARHTLLSSAAGSARARAGRRGQWHDAISLSNICMCSAPSSSSAPEPASPFSC